MEKENKSAVENFKAQEVDMSEQVEEAPKNAGSKTCPQQHSAL